MVSDNIGSEIIKKGADFVKQAKTSSGFESVSGDLKGDIENYEELMFYYDTFEPIFLNIYENTTITDFIEYEILWSERYLGRIKSEQYPPTMVEIENILPVKHFVFNKYIKHLKTKLEQIEQDLKPKFLTSVKSDKQGYKERPSHRQIALFYYYMCKSGLSDPINVSNRNEIAKRYKYFSSTSGQKIYQKYNTIRSTNSLQRTAPGKTTIIDLERVVEMLKDNPAVQKTAKDELKIAQNNAL